MNKFFKFSALCALALSTLAACKDDGPGQQEPEKLAVPTGLAEADITTTGATLKWNAVAGAQSYLVKVGDATPVAAAETSHTLTGLTSKTAYSWQVQAVKGSIKSEFSAAKTFTTAEETPPPPPLGVPTWPYEWDVTHEGANLFWGEVEGATSYDLKITTMDVEDHIVNVTKASATTEEWAPGPLSPAEEIIWAVRACRGDEKGEWTEEQSFFLADPPPVVRGCLVYGQAEFYGPTYGADTSHFLFLLTEFDYGDTSVVWEGHCVWLDLLSAVVEGVDGVFEIPEGTYTVNDSGEPGTIMTGGDSDLWLVVDDDIPDENIWAITGGTVVVSRDGENYVIAVDLIMDDGACEYGGDFYGTIAISDEREAAGTMYISKNSPKPVWAK